jgi:DNA-binding transcriptional MerR regulator
LRPVDLARLGGISVQQVRNYVELGFLPPVERTESGYRIFTTEHAEALAVIRKVAQGHGWRQARTIMSSIHRGDVAAALAEVDAGHAELDRERADIPAVLAAFTTVAAGSSAETTGRSTTGSVGAPGRGRGRGGGLSIGEVAEAAGVHTPVLRLWEQRGLLRPDRQPSTGYRVYDEAELRNARLIALLRRASYPFPIVRAVIDELRASGSPERARAELARREHDLRQQSMERLEASAAVHAYLQGRLRRRGDGPPETSE